MKETIYHIYEVAKANQEELINERNEFPEDFDEEKEKDYEYYRKIINACEDYMYIDYISPTLREALLDYRYVPEVAEWFMYGTR